MKCNSPYACLPVAAAWVELVWGACPVPGLELPSPGSGGVDLGAVPVAEMMDNLWITVSRHGTCFWDSRSCMCTRCEKSEKEGKAYVLC